MLRGFRSRYSVRSMNVFATSLGNVGIIFIGVAIIVTPSIIAVIILQNNQFCNIFLNFLITIMMLCKFVINFASTWGVILSCRCISFCFALY